MLIEVDELSSCLSLSERAMRLAFIAHARQCRKMDGQPFITHPVAVAQLLARHGFNDTIVAAGYLHDVLEDTDISDRYLWDNFGEEVTHLVLTVTHQGDGPGVWYQAREAYINQVRHGPLGAKAIAAADKIHNMTCMMESIRLIGPSVHDHFACTWEERLWYFQTLLDVLRETWSHPIVDEFTDKLIEFKIYIGPFIQPPEQ